MEFELYRLCGSAHLSALIKQTRQRISILSHRLLGVHSSETLITPVLDSGKPLFRVFQVALPLHGAHEQLENRHISGSGLGAKVWGGSHVVLRVQCPESSGEEKIRGGNHLCRQGDSQPYTLHSFYRYLQCITWKWNTHLIGVEACEIICLPWIWPRFFYQPGWCLMLTATRINTFSCAKMSIMWNTIVLGHFSIFSGEKLVKYKEHECCLLSWIHRRAQPPTLVCPFQAQPGRKIHAGFFCVAYKAIFLA